MMSKKIHQLRLKGSTHHATLHARTDTHTHNIHTITYTLHTRTLHTYTQHTHAHKHTHAHYTHTQTLHTHTHTTNTYTRTQQTHTHTHKHTHTRTRTHYTHNIYTLTHTHAHTRNQSSHNTPSIRRLAEYMLTSILHTRQYSDLDRRGKKRKTKNPTEMPRNVFAGSLSGIPREVIGKTRQCQSPEMSTEDFFFFF